MGTISSQILDIWTVFERPADYPDQFVARLWHVTANEAAPTPDILFGDSLAEVRAKLPAGLGRIPRNEGDEPHIVESWL